MQNIVLPHSFINYYIILWVLLIIIDLVVISFGFHKFKHYKNYLRFIFLEWKLLTFLVVTIILSAIAPIANDPTWDIPETIIMCTLTFLTAPWAVGIIYRAVVLYERNGREIYTAIIIWLFSSSWSYDLYVWIWQGVYPISWSGNLMISPILYFCAGMFWSLEYREGKGVIFSFRERQWIMNNLPKGQFQKLLPYMMIFFLLGIVIFGGFLYVNI